MTVSSLVFIAVVMAQYPWLAPEKKWVVNKSGSGGSYIPTDRYNFNRMKAAGICMLAVYVLPMIMRPKDFLYNFNGYFTGVITYIFLLPMFVNIM